MDFFSLKRVNDKIKIIDQRKLPEEYVVETLETYEDVYYAIKDMKLRGAPLIGIAAAYGLWLALKNSEGDLTKEFTKAYELLKTSRPTAVNLFWALDRMKNFFEMIHSEKKRGEVVAALRNEADKIFEEDAECSRKIGENLNKFIKDNYRILTHCNAGALATAKYGTALAGIYVANEEGKKISVWVDETRPWLQGARLTAWELNQNGIETRLIVDSAAALLMKKGVVDMVIVGADRVARNGDVANKIGTYALSVLAKEHNIPFYVAAPSSTIDENTKTGDDIIIEERSDEEITVIKGNRIAPENQRCFNPVFDITPFENITAIITENGEFKRKL